MNWYFYKIFLPLVFLWVLVFFEVCTGKVSLSWPTISISWFLIGPIGVGVGYHRLFSHRQFKTNLIVERGLATLGTLSAYAPLLFWVGNHQFHHNNSDQDGDLSSPTKYGFWQSFLIYRLKKSILNKVHLENYCARKVIIDPYLRRISRYFVEIVWITFIFIGLIGGFGVLANLLIVPIFLEHLRINVVSSVSHLRIPFSYRNHNTNDSSYNNLVLGFITFGFAWHNNHHFDPRKLILNDQWWEVDIEGILAKSISSKKT